MLFTQVFHRLPAILCLLILLGAQWEAQAQTPGQRVVVTANVDTKIYKDNVDKVYTGDIHTVIAVEGKWCALSRVKGWPFCNVQVVAGRRRYWNAVKRSRLASLFTNIVAFAKRAFH